MDKSSAYSNKFHLFRLLLLYHEPQLCSFLDTKKVSPESYLASWFETIFADDQDNDVTSLIRDFTVTDPSLEFFLSLVLLINASDQITEMKDSSSEQITEFICNIPKIFEPEDVGDLFDIVQKHYVPKTPSVNQLQLNTLPSSESSLPGQVKNEHLDLADALCLPVDVHELIPKTSSSIKYFIVDCRPAMHYNTGHLCTAFHLDCDLMLHDKKAFEIAVAGLLAVSGTTSNTATNSSGATSSGGRHVCLIGSGISEFDQTMLMVIAWFLQNHHKYISFAFGGFKALHQLLLDSDQEHLLTDHDKSNCYYCRGTEFNDSSCSESGDSDRNWSLFDKLTSVVKKQSTEMKSKLNDLMANSSADRFRGMTLLADDEDLSDDDPDAIDVIQDLDTWTKEQNAVGCFRCRAVRDSSSTKLDHWLVLTEKNIFIIKEFKKKNFHKILAKRPLDMIVQITSKRKIPEVITFKYGETSDTSGPNIIATDCLLFTEPFLVTRLVKQQVMKVLDTT